MAKTTLPIANGFYVSSSKPLSAQQCINLYPAIIEVESLSQEVLFGTPGMFEVANSGGMFDANRGSRIMNGIPYFVNGDGLFRLNRTQVVNDVVYSLDYLGPIVGEGRVSMADNGLQLCILVPGEPSTGYIFTEATDVLQTITDPDFKANGEPQAVVFIDGYFVFTLNNKKFIVSAINDGLSYNALDFGSAEADPDLTTLPVVLQNQLFIAGSQTIEQFQNVGGSGFPFQRTGLFSSTGAVSQFLATQASESFMFVGSGKNESPAIWQFVGNGVERRSTAAVDAVLQRLTPDDIADSFAWSYAQEGGYFVCFSFPDTTLVYDTVSTRWHERKSIYENKEGRRVTTRCRVSSIVSAYGEVYVGDLLDGRIGRLDLDTYTEYEEPLIAVVATMPFQNQGNSFTVPELELTIESGVGNENCVDPQIRMDRSIDGGKTWKDERSRSMGKIGEYKKRAIWRRNGRAARFEMFRFTISDPVKRAILKLEADVI